MTCRQLVELVTDYFEGKLSWRQKRRFEKHIAGCEWCTRYLEQMRVTIRTLGRLDADSIPPQARDALLAEFRTWNAGS